MYKRFVEKLDQFWTTTLHIKSGSRALLRVSPLLLLAMVFNAQANTPLAINVVDTNNYGFGFNGTRTNPDTADFTFSGGQGDLLLSLSTFDIDSTAEVEVLVNGTSLTHLGITDNNGIGQDNVTIPKGLQIAGENTLQFDQRVSGWRWGITEILLTAQAFPELTLSNVDTTSYGFHFNGITSHRNGAEFLFQGTTDDLTLSFDAFDIDSSKEINVLVNGQSIGHADKTSNNGNGNTSLTIPASAQISGINSLQFEQLNPGWIWGINNLLLETKQIVLPELIIGTTHNENYGFRFNGLFANQDEAIFQFQGNGDELSLTLDTFKINSNTEITVLLNDVAIGNLSKTGSDDYGTSTVAVPSVADGSSNTLKFEQANSGHAWGISDLLLETATEPHLIHDELHSSKYGHAYTGAISKPINALFTFDYSDSNLLLELDTFDIDENDEVQVLVNGAQIAYLDTTANNDIGSSSILIPADYLQSGTNEINFVQKTPSYRWGVSNLILKSQPVLVPAISQYDLVFNDEFNGNSLDNNKWNTGLLWGPYQAINAEEQLYVDTLGMHQNSDLSPFVLTGDSLIIRATEVGGNVQPPPRPPQEDPIWDEFREYRYNEDGYDPANVNYLSGIITTYDTFRMTHGYVEARAKLPTGRGLWPAFWLLNSHYVEDSPEIDVMEFLGHEPDTLYHTYHYFEPHNDYRRVSTPSFEVKGPNWTHGFHTYGMAWSPKEIVWYVDGVETRRITDTEFTIPKQGMYILANLAVGGNWPGSPDANTPFPAEYEIDYIRAYKKKLSPTLDLAADYQMLFNDEFNGSALDPTKWNTSFLWGPYFAINNEEQYYVDALGSDSNIGYTPFDVSNGTLTITAELKDNSPANVPPTTLPGPNEPIWSDNREFRQGPYAGAPDYTSGLITSYDSFKFVNGYAEIRAKVPVGDGLWPAFWLLNAYYVGNLPEIDIMEILGENPSTAYHTYHRSETGGIEVADQFVSSHGTPAIGYSDDFHTFGVRWQPGKITYYVDGQVVDTYEEPANENHAYQLMYVLANLAVGGDFNTKAVDPSALPAKYEIDYVRVYQEKDTP